ncbi:MAG: 5-guanidino-2-oxopentanoate decarboxylase [Paracoccaceae bacterium]
MTASTLGAGIAQALRSHHVDTVFGIPGVHNVELYRGLTQAGIRHVLARHEQGVGFMADGYARATGKPGVALVISGPGLTNILTPMAQAYSDSVPMLVISSCLPRELMRTGRLHQMRDQNAAAASVCEFSHTAHDADSAYTLLNRAFGEFHQQRARPKHISVPLDVLSGEPGTPPPPETAKPYPRHDDKAVRGLASLLDGAQKPLFIFGGGARHAADVARALCEKSGAATLTSYAGRGVVAGTAALNFGAMLADPESAKVIGAADLVLVVGCELAEVDLWRDQLGHTGTLVRIDIDPAVLGDLHNADVTILGDAAPLLRALCDLITAAPARWDAGRVAAMRARARARTIAARPAIAPLSDALHGVLPADALIYSDMTQFAYVAKEIYPLDRPGLWHHPFGFGTLGYALPAAIGGKIGEPARAVVAIAGDYGFQYTMAELGVAAELSLCLPVILWDNGKLKEIEDNMIAAQIAPNAVIAKNPDFATLAKAYGVAYVAPASINGFRDAMRAALQIRGPTIIHVTPVTAGG